MEHLLRFAAEYGDRLSSVAILMIAIIGVVYVALKINKQKEDCEKERLNDREEIGNIRGDVKALQTKLDVQEASRASHLEEIKSLHTNMLKIVAGQNDA